MSSNLYKPGDFIVVGDLKYDFYCKRELSSGLSKEYYKCLSCPALVHVYVELKRFEIRVDHRKRECYEAHQKFMKAFEEKFQRPIGMESILVDSSDSDESLCHTMLETTADLSILDELGRSEVNDTMSSFDSASDSSSANDSAFSCSLLNEGFVDPDDTLLNASCLGDIGDTTLESTDVMEVSVSGPPVLTRTNYFDSTSDSSSANDSVLSCSLLNERFVDPDDTLLNASCLGDIGDTTLECESTDCSIMEVSVTSASGPPPILTPMQSTSIFHKSGPTNPKELNWSSVNAKKPAESNMEVHSAQNPRNKVVRFMSPRRSDSTSQATRTRYFD